MKRTLFAMATSVVLPLCVFAVSPAVMVTRDMLHDRKLPAMTALDHDGSGDWTSVGETQKSDYNQELAHLNDDGELVLVDDEGFQYHAVWAASRPVTPAMNWQVSFRYIPVPNPETRYYDAGGWTFVMQKKGPTAYGTLSPLLGVPAGAYGFMFHRYYLGVRWVKNSNQVSSAGSEEWTHIIATNRNETSIAYTEGLDLNMTNAMDVTIGCTGRVWTVTMRQEGKSDIVLSHDFSDIIADNGTEYYIGFTGASSWWGAQKSPMMYQKIANVTGEIDVSVPWFADAGPAYALNANAWKTAEYAEFLEDGRLLVLDPYTASGNRKFAATGQSPLCRKLPFRVSFDWECEYGKQGAQGVSFSLVPTNTPTGGSSESGLDFFYPGDAHAAGFYLRPYSNEGFGWHKSGVRTSAGVAFSNISSGEVMHVSAEWDGDSRMIVAIQRNAANITIRTNTFDNLPDVFYPAFHGATAYYSDGPTRFVTQNYAMRVMENRTPFELGDRVVAGAQEYVLSTWSASAYMPSAIADTLTMGTDAALALSPSESGVGGSLHVSNIAVRAASSIAAGNPCSLVVSKLSYHAASTLSLSGRVMPKDGLVRIGLEGEAFQRPGRYVLLDASGATGLQDAEFAIDEAPGFPPGLKTQLDWDGNVLTFTVKGGFVILFR